MKVKKVEEGTKTISSTSAHYHWWSSLKAANSFHPYLINTIRKAHTRPLNYGINPLLAPVTFTTKAKLSRKTSTHPVRHWNEKQRHNEIKSVQSAKVTELKSVTPVAVAVTQPTPTKDSDDIFTQMRKTFPFPCYYFECDWAFHTEARLIQHVQDVHLREIHENVSLEEGLLIPSKTVDLNANPDLAHEFELIEEVLFENGIVLPFPRIKDQVSSVVTQVGVEPVVGPSRSMPIIRNIPEPILIDLVDDEVLTTDEQDIAVEEFMAANEHEFAKMFTDFTLPVSGFHQEQPPLVLTDADFGSPRPD